MPRVIHRLSWALLVLALVTVLAVVAGLTFSVRVRGHSMDPTLRSGDRLVVNFFGSRRVERFDLVETTFNGGPAVKRVIGLPGDRLSVSIMDGRSVVLLTPAGSSTTYRVDNPAWAGQPGSAQRPCCTPDGKDAGSSTDVTVPDGQYWLIGDNWGRSQDSRVFGFVPKASIGASLNFRLLPLGSFGRVRNGVRLLPASP